MHPRALIHFRWLTLMLLALLCGAWPVVGADVRFTASSAQPNNGAALAMDGDRFGLGAGHGWASSPGTSTAWWQVEFPEPRRIGAILQVVGNHDFVLTNAPSRYVWKVSVDGVAWTDLDESRVAGETRLYRLHRLHRSRTARFARLEIDAVKGEFTVLREVEFYADPATPVPFPEWVLAVNVTHDSRLPGHGQEFIPLARSVSTNLAAQQVWLVDFTPEFVAVEPRPLCAFLSGSFKDWCEVDRGHWRGTQRVLEEGRLPMWASCGGAQGLAILAETGVDQRWDCPHCRDPLHAVLPIYGHIGHSHEGHGLKCGDYSDCTFERGPHRIRQLGREPVFAGLPEDFMAVESHCGQIEWAPRGWKVIAVGGAGTRTHNQCLRVVDRPIYAAQFHIEMTGAPETSRIIMANFLAQARGW